MVHIIWINPYMICFSRNTHNSHQYAEDFWYEFIGNSRHVVEHKQIAIPSQLQKRNQGRYCNK